MRSKIAVTLGTLAFIPVLSVAVEAGTCRAEERAQGRIANFSAVTDGAKIQNFDLDYAGISLAQIGQFGYVASSALWERCQIFVCWADVYDEHSRDKRLVRNAVESSWEYYSQLELHGWELCPEEVFDGIGITISEERPAAGIGTQARGRTDAVSLNLTQPSLRCANGGTLCPLRIFRLEAQVVHEFGHALGIVHEHMRPDKHDGCSRSEGTTGDAVLTPYDPHSEMNWCNGAKSSGKLSYGDVLTIVELFGAPDWMLE